MVVETSKPQLYGV